MISLLWNHWLCETLPDVSILLMGVLDLNLRTTNNTRLSIEHVALVNFALKPNIEKIKVPFSITSESVESRIFGYSLIEHIFYILLSASSHISSERAETVASIIQKVAEVPDLPGKKISSPVKALWRLSTK